MSPSVTDAPAEFSQRGPVEIAAFLDGKAQELHALQAQLEKAHNEAENAEIKWMAHFDKVMDALEIELEEEGAGGKLPGEEKCVGIARRREGWEAWSTWRRAERRVKKLEKLATLIDNQISACQSEGKLLRAVA